MRVSCYYIMTEPEKMGYPYMESIISSLHVCDEVVVVLGRNEEESDKKFNNLKSFLKSDRKNDFLGQSFSGKTKKELKIVRTNSWPEINWSYDTMRDHFQIGLDACTGDLCINMGADFVFRNQHAAIIRKELIKFASDYHYVPFNLLHFYRHHLLSFRPDMTKDLAGSYIINKKKLKEDGATCKINNESGSNRPIFFNKDGQEYEPSMGLIGNLVPFIKDQKMFERNFDYCVECLLPINYSYTFCTKEQIAKYWARISKAKWDKFNDKPQFDYDDLDVSFEYFLKYYHEKKIPKRVSKNLGPSPDQIYTTRHGRNSTYFFSRNGVMLSKEITYANADPINVIDQGMPSIIANVAAADLSKYAGWSETEAGKHEKIDFVFSIFHHPTIMQQKIMTLDKTMWGYNNFQEEWEKIKK